MKTFHSIILLCWNIRFSLQIEIISIFTPRQRKNLCWGCHDFPHGGSHSGVHRRRASPAGRLLCAALLPAVFYLPITDERHRATLSYFGGGLTLAITKSSQCALLHLCFVAVWFVAIDHTLFSIVCEVMQNLLLKSSLYIKYKLFRKS